MRPTRCPARIWRCHPSGEATTLAAMDTTRPQRDPRLLLRAARSAPTLTLGSVAISANAPADAVTLQTLHLAAIGTPRRRCPQIVSAVLVATSTAKGPVYEARRTVLAHRLCPPPHRRLAAFERLRSTRDAPSGSAGWAARSPGIAGAPRAATAALVAREMSKPKSWDASKTPAARPAAVCGRLADHRDGWWRAAAAADKNCPPWALATIAGRCDLQAAAIIARHPSARRGILAKAAATAGLVAAIGTASEDAVQWVLTAARFARDPRTPSSLLTALAGSAATRVRRNVAANAACAARTLDALRHDTSTDVRVAASDASDERAAR